MNTSRFIKAFLFSVIISISIGDITYAAIEMNTNGLARLCMKSRTPLGDIPSRGYHALKPHNKIG